MILQLHDSHLLPPSKLPWHRLHTAATTLLLLGIPERAVMDMMGWSQAAMVRRYSHVTARLRRDIADRLNTHLWERK